MQKAMLEAASSTVPRRPTTTRNRVQATSSPLMRNPMGMAATTALECRDSMMASMICIMVMAEVESIMGPASFSRRGMCVNMAGLEVGKDGN